MANKRRREFTRRELLQGAGAVGAVTATAGSAELEATRGRAVEPSTEQTTLTAPARETYEHLTAEEAELLEAIADHLIPADESGPGAVEARAVHYIDRALGGALADTHDAYRSGLAAFDRYCRASRGGPFLALERRDRISVLIDVETGAATGANTGFVRSSAAFFDMVRDHVLEGTFGDPYYGGNANFVGWDLIGYPGVRTAVTPVDQRRLESDELPPYRRSAYDWEEFNKASVRAGQGGPRHGD